jgi:hypothetical protein
MVPVRVVILWVEEPKEPKPEERLPLLLREQKSKNHSSKDCHYNGEKGN